MGCADVCLDHGYDDNNEFFSQRDQTARKRYSCVECGRPIEHGSRYEYCFGKTDGLVWTERTCLVCVEVREAFVCGSFCFSMLWDSIQSEIFPRWGEEGPFDCLAKLDTDDARAYIQRRYDEWCERNFDPEDDPRKPSDRR